MDTRVRFALIAVLAVLLVGGATFALTRGEGGDTQADATPTTTSPSLTETTPTPTAATQPTASPAPTPTPSPTSTPVPSPTPVTKDCEGPKTQFNVEGIEQDSLLPDCGEMVVTTAQQEKGGLTLGCGGTYPAILFKSKTGGAKTSICGSDASGEDFRFVTRAGTGAIKDLQGRYDPGLDAFTANDGGTSYVLSGTDGSLTVSKDGKSTVQASSDFISLDNEPDGD